MKKYEVSGHLTYLDVCSVHGSRTVIVEAENEQEALEKARNGDEIDAEVFVDDFSVNDYGDTEFDSDSVKEVE